MMRKEMESFPFQIKKDEQHMELPPGFRFHPTDEELITHYLSHKVLDSCFRARAIGEVDLNKCEPWDLPWRAKMGEKEWYFFCLRDRKYPTGLRTNRATGAGYWKATGKDREIYRGRTLVGMKKTLVFYGGRAPKGVKSDWVMHEYRLEGRQSYNLPKKSKNEWVICRVFQKSAGGEKTHISGLVRLPSLTDSSPNRGEPQTGTVAAAAEARVTCSIPSEEDYNAHLGPMINQAVSSSTAAAILQSPVSLLPQSLFTAPQPQMAAAGMKENHQVYRDYGLDDHSILGIVVGNLRSDGWESPGVEYSQDTEEMSNHEMGQRSVGDPEEDGSGSGGPVDIDCLWTY